MPDYQRPNNEDLFHLPLGDIEAILGDANNILILDSNEKKYLLFVYSYFLQEDIIFQIPIRKIHIDL